MYMLSLQQSFLQLLLDSNVDSTLVILMDIYLDCQELATTGVQTAS